VWFHDAPIYRCFSTRFNVRKRAERGCLRQSNTQQATSRGTYSGSLFPRGTAWPRDAILDDKLNSFEPALLLHFERLNTVSWRLAAIALAIQVGAVVFSLVGPVPINNRIAKWTPESLPIDWRNQEHRWDLYHGVRTVALIIAFALLVLSVGLR